MIYINSEWNIFPLWFMAKAFFQIFSSTEINSEFLTWLVKVTNPCDQWKRRLLVLATNQPLWKQSLSLLEARRLDSLCGPTSIYCHDDVFNGVVAMVRVFLVLMPCYKRVLCKDTTRVTKHCLLYKLVPKDV